MATKIAISGPTFVPSDDMASIEFFDGEPTAEMLEVLPVEEIEYMQAKKIERAERRAVVRDTRADKVDAIREIADSAEWKLLVDTAHALSVAGTRNVLVSAIAGNVESIRISAGARDHYTLARVEKAHVKLFAKKTVSRMTPRGQESVTSLETTHVYRGQSWELVASIKAYAPQRVRTSSPSAFRIESGKPSRKKSTAHDSRMASAQGRLLRTSAQLAQFAMRATIEAKLANGEPVSNSEWKTALGRSLTVTEMKATKRQRDGADLSNNGSHGEYAGKASAMSRMLNSLDRK